ncbi:hypothetical protein JW978_04170 [Candidatus Dojkabacteria bacterium]|nr:hypothetical protein [Candidatus Dojkabacteria bacterium]
MKKTLITLIVFELVVLMVITGIIVCLTLRNYTNGKSETIITTPDGNAGESEEGFPDNIVDAQTSEEPSTYIVKAFGNFSGFSFDYPSNWTVEKDEKGNIYQNLTLTKIGGYELSIRRASGDGQECHLNSNFSQEMTDFNIDITKYDYNFVESKLGRVYYFAKDKNNAYEYCIPGKDNPNKMYIFSDLGIITLETPASPDGKAMQEMEDIISSLNYLD